MSIAAPPTSPPPGWHHDPFGMAPLRWWDGQTWSPWVWHEGGPGGPGPAADPTDARWYPDIRTLRFPAAILAASMVVLLIVGNLTTVALVDSAQVVAALIGLGILALTAVGFPLAGIIASKRWGSGRIRRDIGLRFRWIDLPLGFAGAVAMFLTIVISGLILHAIGVPQTSNLEQYGDDPSGLLIALLFVLAGVIAPVSEEILFRGVLLRGLTDRWSIPLAIAGQGALFGVAHVMWDGGWGNFGLVIPLALVGCVLGFLARWTGRLGTTIAAHCIFNVAQLLIFIAVGTS